MGRVTARPTPEEAAAVIAAIEQFLRDTTAGSGPEEETVSGWLRTARIEAVDRDPQRF
jgi:hypothetical protein